jgi:AcrR family transcriptional regulator
MLAPHWKADPRHESYDAIRMQIVRAAHQLLIAERRPRLHMGELAEVCGLSRATLYRYFGDKEELVAAVYVLCVESLAEEFRGEIRRFDDPAEQLVEGLMTMVAYVRGHTTIVSEFAPGAHDERMRDMSLRSRGEMARALVRPILDVLPLAFESEDHERRAALWLRAILISLVVGALSEIDSPDETRRLLHQFVVPSLGLPPGRARDAADGGDGRPVVARVDFGTVKRAGKRSVRPASPARPARPGRPGQRRARRKVDTRRETAK